MWQGAPDLSGLPNVRVSGLAEWSVETLLRDALAYGGLYGTRLLMEWNQLAELINKLNSLENEIWVDAPNGMILYELFRIGHRQFDWQSGFGRRDFARYLSIYEHGPMRSLVVREFGMNPGEIIKAAVVLLGLFRTRRLVELPIPFDQLGLPKVETQHLLERLTTNLSELAILSKDDSKPDIDFAYRPTALRMKPVVKLASESGGQHVYCPVFRFLAERLTDGMYYDLVGRRDFANPYGFGFQRFIERLAESLNDGGYVTLKEAKYGNSRHRLDSTDLILSDATADLFVECKSRRVSSTAKTSLTIETMEGEMDKAVDALVQGYKKVHDALQGRFEHWKPRSLPSYLMVVMLRPWHINSPRLFEYIERTTQERLVAEGVSPMVMREAPYTICSSADFEALVCALRETSLDRLLGQKVEESFARWELSTFIASQLPGATKRQSFTLDFMYKPLERALDFDFGKLATTTG